MKTVKKEGSAGDDYPPIITLKDASDWCVVPLFEYQDPEEKVALVYFMDKFEPPNTAMLNKHGYVVEGNIITSSTYPGLFFYKAEAKK